MICEAKMTNPTNDSISKKLDSDPIDINIWLDSYNDMFSDFDPSPYSKRTISDDFISQVRKVVKDRYRKKMNLILLLPESARNKKDEQIISEHIHNYFKTNNHQLLEEKRKINQKGLMLTLIGIILMLMASYLSFLKSESYVTHVLLILFEPAGWFMIWMGLDQLVNYSSSKRKELVFYAHMAETTIKFGTYGQD